MLIGSAVAAAGLTGYLAIAAPAPASSASTNSNAGTTADNGASDTPQTTQGTIPRRSRNRNSVPVPSPSTTQPQQQQPTRPHTRSAGS